MTYEQETQPTEVRWRLSPLRHTSRRGGEEVMGVVAVSSKHVEYRVSFGAVSRDVPTARAKALSEMVERATWLNVWLLLKQLGERPRVFNSVGWAAHESVELARWQSIAEVYERVHLETVIAGLSAGHFTRIERSAYTRQVLGESIVFVPTVLEDFSNTFIVAALLLGSSTVYIGLGRGSSIGEAEGGACWELELVRETLSAPPPRKTEWFDLDRPAVDEFRALSRNPQLFRAVSHLLTNAPKLRPRGVEYVPLRPACLMDLTPYQPPWAKPLAKFVTVADFNIDNTWSRTLGVEHHLLAVGS